MRTITNLLLLSYLMVATNVVATAAKSESGGGYDVSSFSPEQQVWENLLARHLGGFYYPLYIEAKNAGKQTEWDYVKDVPGLPRMLVIGDSISCGYTLPLRSELEGKVNVHRAPRNCGNTSVGVKELDVWLGDGNWDVISFNFGIHDSVARFSSADYKKRLHQIANRLKATNAKLIWVNTTPVPRGCNEYVNEHDIERLNKVADAVMKEQRIPILDLNRSITPYLGKYRLPANCHYREEGYRYMGKLVAEKIMAEL